LSRILAEQPHWHPHYRRYRHTATLFPISHLGTTYCTDGLCRSAAGLYFFILIYPISIDPTVLDEFTKQADFASAAPFGLGRLEERLDFDRLLERDGAFPPTQLIRV